MAFGAGRFNSSEEAHAPTAVMTLDDHYGVYVPNELRKQTLEFKTPVRVLVSQHNPGAQMLAEEVMAKYAGFTFSSEPLREHLRRSNTRGLTLSSLSPVAMSPNSSSRRFSGFSPSTMSGAGTDGYTHMILYLTDKTWFGDSAIGLASDVRKAWDAGLPVELVHELDPNKVQACLPLHGVPFHRPGPRSPAHQLTSACHGGTCPALPRLAYLALPDSRSPPSTSRPEYPNQDGMVFDVLFDGRTPVHMLDGGVYKKVAFAMHPGPHREVSLALLAKGLGAARVKPKMIGPKLVLQKPASCNVCNHSVTTGKTKAPGAMPPMAAEHDIASSSSADAEMASADVEMSITGISPDTDVEYL